MPRSDRVSDEFFIRNMLIIPNQIQQSPRRHRCHHDPSELRGTCEGRRRRREERRSTNLIAKFFPIIAVVPFPTVNSCPENCLANETSSR